MLGGQLYVRIEFLPLGTLFAFSFIDDANKVVINKYTFKDGIESTMRKPEILRLLSWFLTDLTDLKNNLKLAMAGMYLIPSFK